MEIPTEADTYDLVYLDQVIENYDFETDPVLQKHFHALEKELCDRIQTYGAEENEYGRQITDHLRRTSEDGRDFLVGALGFSEEAGNNFYHANLLQDLGKIHPRFEPELWSLPHRPTEEERVRKRKHTFRGPEVFFDALKDAPQDLLDHPHIKLVIPAIQVFHHERVDGSGPFGKTGDEMGLVIKTACIVDAKDGDMIKRPHQPKARTEEEALERLKTGEKYQGAFDDLLDIYIHTRQG